MPHADYALFLNSRESLNGLQRLGNQHGIGDLAQDNNLKTLEIILCLDLRVLNGREGNDVADTEGNEYELKTANMKLVSGVSTHHHLNEDIIAKYERVGWIFAFYRDITLESIYLLMPPQMSIYYNAWRAKLRTISHINNPKIQTSHIRQHGCCLYPPPAVTLSDARTTLLQRR